MIVAKLWIFLAQASQRNLLRWRKVLRAIDEFGGKIREESDESLLTRSQSLGYRARSGESLARLLPEAFALVRETAARHVGMRHYDVQIFGGIAMFQGAVVEMETGEGKTLAATLPVYLNALAGRGVHVVTVNDYLARRDADWMRPIFENLGVTVGVVETQMAHAQRQRAYACDITYGTASEFGFDFLRDRLQSRQSSVEDTVATANMPGDDSASPQNFQLQREPCFALIDEADSVLIDEARTPLVVNVAPKEDGKMVRECFSWAAQNVSQLLIDEHYQLDPKDKSIRLSATGRQHIRTLSKPETLNQLGLPAIYEHIERAIKVGRDFQRDRHYIVRNGEVAIVDELTGRVSEGRKWRGGIHQALEAKEGLEISADWGPSAQVTIQELFRRYPRLAGMTGTAMSSAREFRKVYGLRVVSVPTHRPGRRIRQRQQILRTTQEKWNAVVREVEELIRLGRPVLIGTRSIDKSEHLSRLLKEKGIVHRVLNAVQLADEAGIVLQAGQPRQVTVATNMAGRGTDICLGDGVAKLGGLHVIGSEMHDSARIDRQLAGRCARQGDPGSFRQFLSLDDEILSDGLSPSRVEGLKQLAARSNGSLDVLGSLFLKSQKNMEREHFRERKTLMHYFGERKKTHQQMGQDPYLDVPE